MEQVAKMLGVELDEEFNVDGFGDFFKITKDGLWCKYNKEWKMTILSTEDILCGRIEVIKKPILDDVEKELAKALENYFMEVGQDESHSEN